MPLKDYKPMQERCSNCSFCKWIPFDKVRSSRFAENCPSELYYNFNTYSARGRFQMGLSIVNGEFGFEGRTGEVVHSCMACGACDVACKICRYNLEPYQHNLELKREAAASGVHAQGAEAAAGQLVREQTLLVGKMKADRAEWATGLSLKNVIDEHCGTLFFPGCKYAYDPALRESVRAAASLLTEVGADFGVLGSYDVCCAGRAWQMGEQAAFEGHAAKLLRLLEQSGVEAIVTPCADCYYSLKRLYAEKGLAVRVIHYAEYLDELIRGGQIRFTRPQDLVVTYHDPCHLGRLGEPYVPWEGKEKKILNQIHTWEPRRPRYNGAYGIYDAPRRVIEAIPGVRLQEMERIREYSFCCGAGGGCSVSDPGLSAFTASERINEARATGADAVVTCCPWCRENLGRAEDENGETMRVLDLIDLVRSAL